MKEVQYVGVYGVLLRGDELLVIKKSRGPYIGKWDLPGGGLVHGESLKVGLLREVIEETGVLVTEADPYLNLTYLAEYEKDGEKISLHHIGLVYFAGDYNPSGFISKKEQDVDGAAWISLEALNEEVCSPFLWRVVRSILG